MLRGLLVLGVLVCAAAASAQQATTAKMTIAVNDLSPQGLDASTSSIISDRMRNELFNTGTFVVLERGQMEEILKEQGFQQSGCTSDACAVEIGQLLGVKFLVVGSIGKVGSTFTINVRMIDVATGKITLTANADCKCEIDDVLGKSTVDIANRLSNAVIGKTATAAPAAQPAPPPVAASPAPAKVEEKRAAKTAEAPKKKRLNPLLKVGFACIGLAGAAAGAYMDMSMGQDIKDAEAIRNEYLAAQDNTRYEDFNQRYSSKVSSAETKGILRYVMYGLGGVGALGFGVTIWF